MATQQLTPSISNQLREDFARECQRSPTAEELSLWRSENQHKTCVRCQSLLRQHQLQPCTPSPSTCIPHIPLSGHLDTVSCTQCIQARLCCSLVLEELSFRVKKVLGINDETFITLFREHMSKRVAELTNSRPSGSIGINSALTRGSTTPTTPTIPSPIPNASPAPTASELLPKNISETTETTSLMHRLARFVEHAREANYKLIQKYDASRVECEQLRASLAEKTRHSEAMQRRNEELHQTIQNLRSQLDASGSDTFAVREEAQGLLLRDLQRDVAMEQLKENLTRLEQRVQEEQRAKEAFQQDLIRERAQKDELLAKKQQLEVLAVETKAELTKMSLKRTTLCDATVLVQCQLLQAEEESRNAKQEAGQTKEALDSVKAEMFGQSLEIQRLKEAVERARHEKEDALAGTAELQEAVERLQREKKVTDDAVRHLQSEKESLLTGLTKTQERSQRLLQCQTNELANMKQLVKEFAQVRAHFSANRVTREDVEGICDKLGVDLVVIMNRLKAESSDSERNEPPPKKRKFDHGVP